MASAVGSLWSAQIKPEILSPKQILNTQASALGELTKGLLLGELSEKKVENNKIVLKLDIFAPALKYRHQVLTATYSLPQVYPVILDADLFRRKQHPARLPNALLDALGGTKPDFQADSDEELIDLVQKVLTSPEVVSIAQSLIAQANEMQTETNYIQHLKELSESERRFALEEKVEETSYQLLDSKAFTATVGETNALGWGVDKFALQKIDFGTEECFVHISYSASGEQDEEKSLHGDTVTGTALVIINDQGIAEYRNITAEVVHDTDEPDSEQ